MGLNILIVDDSAVMRSMIRKTMELSGLPLGEVHQAANGREGLTALERNWIDLVIADINMPEMNGEEMIARMQAVPELQRVPTIVVSTEGSRTRIGRLERWGVKFIHKPFSPEMIRDAVREVLGNEVAHGSGAE
ncbi:MAG: response regulator [Desulfobacterales bacterium]|jgi:two-component system chemotaxis response regulator CheY|nr:response regulator [Desulfobacterales bacterium]